LNNSYQAIGSFNLKKNVRGERDTAGGDKLFLNEKGKFRDISEYAGIYGSIVGFGLGVTVGDVNRDGWPDIYVSNDFFERDYLYMNQQDGTFREDLVGQINSISGASMGADMADINNDGLQDIFVTEMLPRDDRRLKTKTTFENWDKYQYNISNQYYHQFTRNMLHQNYDGRRFQEIGRLKGVHATDWSWGALIADFNNDGDRDIFVANGIYQDLTDQDFLNYIGNDSTMSKIISEEGVDYTALIDAIPSNPIPNYMFENEGAKENHAFRVANEDWGFTKPSFSNGAAYGDLDNDGDLDLVINNVNMTSFIYENETDIQDSTSYLQLELRQDGDNHYAIGTTLEVYGPNLYQYMEHYPTRGFQSSMDYKMTIGLGDKSQVDSLIIRWPDGSARVLSDVAIDQKISIQHNTEGFKTTTSNEDVIHPIFRLEKGVVSFRHEENEFVDFDRNGLLYHMRSGSGPCLCKGDVDNDGLEDIYVGGAKDQPGVVFRQNDDGSFVKKTSFTREAISEDTDCTFFDADGDGDADLYVTSGGFEFPETSSALRDRLYINEGIEGLVLSQKILPAGKYESTTSVEPIDYDRDGDMDLVVSVGFKPFEYGIPVTTYLLENNGSGQFRDRTKEVAPTLIDIGLTNDVAVGDINDDGWQDMVVVGEWGSPKVLMYETDARIFQEVTEAIGVNEYSGWWQSVELADIDGDDRLDIIAGNMGLNTSFVQNPTHPQRLYLNDFDQNGSVDHIYARWLDDKQGYYPQALKHDLIKQLPGLKKDFVTYDSYADIPIEEIFSKEQITGSLILEAGYLEHLIMLNRGSQDWEVVPLDYSTQVAPIYSILPIGESQDERLIITGGNLKYVKPEVGKYDASYGNVLQENKEGRLVDVKGTGLLLEGDIRNLLMINRAADKLLIVARNDDTLQTFSYDHK